MRRSRVLSLILFSLTLAPLAIWVYVLVAYGPSMDIAPTEESPEQVLQEPFIRGVMLASLLTIGLMAIYLVHLYSRSRMTSGQRALWLFLIVFVNIVAMPFYWWLHVWPRQNDGAA